MVADFDDLMIQARDALDQIAKGNPEAYKRLYSSQEDITLGIPSADSGAASRRLRTNRARRVALP